jgi:hypothetical protein
VNRAAAIIGRDRLRREDWIWDPETRLMDLETLAQVALLSGVSELSRGIDGEEMCPRCGREQLWIDAEVRARLTVTTGAGGSAFEVVETEPIDTVVWQRQMATWCPACGWKGTVGAVMGFLGRRR